MYIGIQQITPEQFNCETKDEVDESCKNEIEAKPTLVALLPYHQETLLANGKISLNEEYSPTYGGYTVDFTGTLLNAMSSKVNVQNGRKLSIHETDLSFGMDGQRLKIVLSDVSYRRTKTRFSLFGVVGGVASILTALFGVLATLCDPELEMEGELVVQGEGGDGDDVEMMENPRLTRIYKNNK